MGRLFRGTFKVPPKVVSFSAETDFYIDSKHSIRVVLERWSLFRVQSTSKKQFQSTPKVPKFLEKAVPKYPQSTQVLFKVVSFLVKVDRYIDPNPCLEWF